MKEFILATDSCLDYSYEKCLDKNLLIIPINTIIDNEEYGVNKKKISLDEFYNLMRNGKEPTTVAANPLTLEEEFKNVLDKGYDLLYVSFSSGLSSSFQNAYMVINSLREKYPDRIIEIVDSKSASAIQNLIIDIAIDLKEKTNDIIKTKEELEKLVDYSKVEFLIQDLFHLQRGGRISKSSALIGSALKIIPILTVNIDGKIVPADKIRGRKKAILKIYENMVENYDNDFKSNIYISHSGCVEDVNFLARKIKEHFKIEPIICEMVITIAAHTGPDSLVLSYMSKEKRK